MKQYQFGMTPDEVIREGWTENLTFDFTDEWYDAIENALIQSEKFSIIQKIERGKINLLDSEDTIDMLSALTEYANSGQPDSNLAKRLRIVFLEEMKISEN